METLLLAANLNSLIDEQESLAFAQLEYLIQILEGLLGDKKTVLPISWKASSPRPPLKGLIEDEPADREKYSSHFSLKLSITSRLQFQFG